MASAWGCIMKTILYSGTFPLYFGSTWSKQQGKSFSANEIPMEASRYVAYDHSHANRWIFLSPRKLTTCRKRLDMYSCSVSWFRLSGVRPVLEVEGAGCLLPVLNKLTVRQLQQRRTARVSIGCRNLHSWWSSTCQSQLLYTELCSRRIRCIEIYMALLDIYWYLAWNWVP